MAEEKEVLKYELDVTDVEAKAQRLLQLQAQIAAARGKGEKTDELEAQMNKELDGLGKLAGKKNEDLSAGELLVKNKEKLAGAMNLVAAGAGETAGRLANLVQMLIEGGMASAAWAGAAVGVVALIAGYRQLEEEARKATETQVKLNEAVRKGQEAKLTDAQQIGRDLAAMGARSAANVDEGLALSQQLRKRFGFSREDALGAAGVATAADMSVDEAAVLAQFRAQGVPIRNVKEARAVLARARANGDYDRLLANARELDVGKQDEFLQIEAAGGGGAARQPIEAVYGALAKTDKLGGMSFEDFRKAMEDLNTKRARLALLREKLSNRRPGETWWGPVEKEIGDLQDEIARVAWAEPMVRREAERTGGPPTGDVSIDSDRYNPKEKTGRAGTLDRLNASPQQTTVNNHVVNISQQVVTNPLRWENFWFPGYAGDSERGGNR